MKLLATLGLPVRAEVRLASGIRLKYVQQGPPDGPAVVMLHGYSDSSFSFSRVLPLMPAHLRVVAIDQRGHGDSDRPDGGYSVNMLANDALMVMDALGITRATVVGHSMGSFVARRIAEIAPARVRRLVLIGTGPSLQKDSLAALRTAIEVLVDPVDEGFIRDFQRSTLFRPVPDRFFEQVVAESRKLPARVWKAVMENLWHHHPRPSIDCPTDVLGGEQDAVFSVEEQAAVYGVSQRGTLHLEPYVGHALHWEAPERFVALAFAKS